MIPAILFCFLGHLIIPSTAAIARQALVFSADIQWNLAAGQQLTILSPLIGKTWSSIHKLPCMRNVLQQKCMFSFQFETVSVVIAMYLSFSFFIFFSERKIEFFFSPVYGENN